jgi:glycosyltransferase involved in cell wall biosynthesis
MDLLCFSHLRWDFVYQRPNHLMARAARRHRVFFVEEPIRDTTIPRLTTSRRDGVTVVVPHIAATDRDGEERQLRLLLDELVRGERLSHPVVWYYTPMALPWTRHIAATARATVYDCMDHLAGFLGAPDDLLDLEQELMASADLVFTGGASLHSLKRRVHGAVHCFPSSVDTAHFGRAREATTDPADQRAIPGPRIGYFGVIDERLDLELIGEVAGRRPDWRLVMVGPVVKIDPDSLPEASNIHYLGPKSYSELPDYLAGWDAAMMPFARNAATRYISPTKTPEYLAGGRPVASTSIHDVVNPYGEAGLVHVGDTPEEFEAAICRALADDREALCRRADAFLANQSWDRTWAQMEALIADTLAARRAPTIRRPAAAATARQATSRSIGTGVPAVSAASRRSEP